MKDAKCGASSRTLPAASLALAAWLSIPSPVLGQVQQKGQGPEEERAPDPPKAAAKETPGRGATVKGWLEAARGGSLLDALVEARLLESYEDRLFIEIPEADVRRLAARHLTFVPVPDADLFGAGPRRFDIRDGEPALDAEWRTAPSEAGGRRPYLIKFDAPIKPEWLGELQAAGAEIVQYQPSFGYLVLGEPGIEGSIGAVSQVAFHGEYHPDYKADAVLKAKAARDEEITLRVVYFDLPGWEQEIDALVMKGVRLADINEAASTSQWALLHYAILEGVRTRDLPAILRAPQVYWAEEWFPPELEGERGAQISAGNIAAGQPLTGYSAWLAGLGADGSGVTVAVADTGLDTGVAATIHEDFQGRVAFATTLCAQNRDRSGHGTNTASIAVGDPRLPTGTNLTDAGGFFWGMGAAPGSFLWYQKALDAGDCGQSYGAQANTLAQDAVRNGGASIGSHSFTDGQGGGGGYTSQAQAWDGRVRDADTGVAGHQPYTVVFSAGNSGPGSGTLTSPKAAKNIITVGATENYRPGLCPGISGCGGSADNIDALVDFSSRGPATDGRIKPDVAAPGHVITGAISSLAAYSCTCDGGGGTGCCASVGVDGSNKYSVYSGTSQAAPRVAGASAVVYDWYGNQFGPFPFPAMNKAILINGALDMATADVPNNNEGWGRINLSRSLQGPTAVRVDQSPILGTTGDPGAFNATYYVQDGTQPVKATLVWTDAPGAVSCNPCLVNDLDLFFTQSATTWRGNNFTSGFSNTNNVADTLNNIEGINLPAGSLSCSSFAVKVRAQTLSGDGVPGNADATDQDFALVIANAAATPGPAILSVSDAVVSGGCDADEFLDRGETITLTVDLTNTGCAAATAAEAALVVDSAPAGAVATVTPPGAQSLGTIAQGATVQQAWQVNLATSGASFCGDTLTLRVDSGQSGSVLWTDTVDVLLDADGFSPITLTDPVNVDNSFSKTAEFNVDNCRVTSPTTSWHFGQSDCTGIVRDASTHDLVFAHSVGASDTLTELSFSHAFNGYSNASFNDSVTVSIDPENDGSFATLATWRSGINAPLVMTLAGPFDLTSFNATHGTTVKVKFTFQGGANWVGGANTAAGWDIDDIVFKYDALACDATPCPSCPAPSGLTNNAAADIVNCQATGIDIAWAADPASWGDGGTGTRSYTVLRDGSPIPSGPCSGTLPYGTTGCTDTTATPGVPHTYQVSYENGCGSSALTAGASATDLALAPPPIEDGTGAGNPVSISYSGGTITLTWDAATCATRYNVYMGTLGAYWNHAIFTAAGLTGVDSCFEPASSASFTDPGGSAYFLIAADNCILESNLGVSTVTNPRPYAATACSPH